MSSWPAVASVPRTCIGLPPGEALRVSLVRDQPWSGYNWYDGGYRSRVDLNLDLPIRLPNLVGTVAHETYPGHHLEHATKEEVLVEQLGRLEASILLINTPECLISEGLANVGIDIAVPPEDMTQLLIELGPVAGLPMAADPDALQRAATRLPAVAEQRAILGEARINAALMLHVDGTLARRGDRLPGRGRPGEPRHGGQADVVRRASPVAAVRLRLHRRRGLAPAVAPGRPAGEPRTRASAGCCASSSPRRRSVPRPWPRRRRVGRWTPAGSRGTSYPLGTDETAGLAGCPTRYELVIVPPPTGDR